MKFLSLIFLSVIIFASANSRKVKKYRNSKKSDSVITDCSELAENTFTQKILSEMSFELEEIYNKATATDRDPCVGLFRKCGNPSLLKDAVKYFDEFFQELGKNQKIDKKYENNDKPIVTLNSLESEAFEMMIKKVANFGTMFYSCLCQEKNQCSKYFKNPAEVLCVIEIDDIKGLVGVMEGTSYEILKVENNFEYRGTLAVILAGLFEGNLKLRDSINTIVTGSNSEIDTEEEAKNYNENCNAVGNLLGNVMNKILSMYKSVHASQGILNFKKSRRFAKKFMLKKKAHNEKKRKARKIK